MNHIIVLPYYCDKEIQNFLQLLQRWNLFCKSECSYSFLIASRFDVSSSSELEYECSKYAPTTSIICDKYQWSGWPAGANGMFRHVMEAIEEQQNKDGGFVFWFEHDVIPIYHNWLDWLHKMWSPQIHMMGQYMSPPWINLHNIKMPININGTACYSKNFASLQAFQDIEPNIPFDYTLSESLSKYGEAKTLALPLFQDLWFFMPDWVNRCDLTKLMINGIKEINQREKVIQYILKNRDEIV